MNDDLIAQIQAFTLNARAILEADAGQQLEGIYGWLPEGAFGNVNAYPAISQFEEARETRRRLEQFAEDEKTAGLSSVDAREKLLRETAFTWLNRLAAFRLVEERKLLKPTIVKLEKSNGFIYWITNDANKDAYELHQRGGLPINAMGEGPIDLAYRRFLLWQCGELARDVSMLFDPDTLSSRLCPRPSVLKELVNNMSEQPLANAWNVGNEETVGWIYQGFNAEELQAAFASARDQGRKFEPEDIPAVTQLFTIRWVVRFLVENTLGQLWLEMHPDSRLAALLSYLVPVESSQARPLKPVRDISFLDPCCGSMHFGLVAFDVFAEMYREELERAGQPGWPAKASVSSADDIPAAIVANNIHGIDIDMRAVQLSALTLLLRARTINPQCAFTDENLACANVEAITGGRLEEFINHAKFSHPIYERILRALAARLKDSNNLGSLLRLERDLEGLVNEERKKAEADKQFTMAFPGLTAEEFKTEAGIEEFFAIVTDQVLRHLDDFVTSSRKQGSDPGHFVSETEKGLRFMRIIRQRFDVVTTNPPYLSSRKMNSRLSTLMGDEYAEGKGDLYAAFIIRCPELLNDSGLLGMLTMHSFMFIGSYESLRDALRKQIAIEKLAHFGGGLFAVGNPGTLQTAAFVFRREQDEQRRDEQIGTYFRFVKEPNAESKRRAFEAALGASRGGEPHPALFRCVQKDFDAIPEKPWVYWIPKSIRDLFANLPSLRSVAQPRVGLQTADNVRFLRKWWEVGVAGVGFNIGSSEQSKASGKRWFPYMKGGTPNAWFGNQEHVVNWENDGAELYAFRPRAVIRNSSFYFRRGVTWSDVSSKGFAGRLSPGGFVHDVSGMSCFPSEPDVAPVMALFNSKLAKYLLSALNPTIHYQVGDIERLPIPRGANKHTLESVDSAVELVHQESRENENSYDFVAPLGKVDDFVTRKGQLAAIEASIDRDVSKLYCLAAEDLAVIEFELASSSTISEENDEEVAEDDEQTAAEMTANLLTQRWISYATGVVLGRFDIGTPNGFGRGNFSADAAASIRKLVDCDGIMTSDLDHPQDIVKRVLTCLELMLGRDEAHTTICVATGQGGDPEELVRDWIDRAFWKYHFQLCRKRPVYWPLQSPKKKLTVWVFHERFTKDTLFKVRSEFVDPKARWLEARIEEHKAKAVASDGRERRAAEKEASKLAETLDDVKDFSERLNRITQGGYTPHIDDGVLLNAAPLWEVLPSWPETKKAWKGLEAEEYDWAQQAMEYWPKRVKEKCQTNRSFAIAHGLA